MTPSYPWHLTPWGPFFPFQSPYVATSAYVLSSSQVRYWMYHSCPWKHSIPPQFFHPLSSLLFYLYGTILNPYTSLMPLVPSHIPMLLVPFTTLLIIFLPSNIPESSSQSVSLPPDPLSAVYSLKVYPLTTFYVTWDQALFLFPFENCIPAGKTKRKDSLIQTFYETSAAHFFDWLTFAESANQNYFRCLFF